MLEDETPRQLVERTGRHRCVGCLCEVSIEEFLRNDHLCDACAEIETAEE